ncbi:DJ-1/PfpI family protein [Streptomyces roseirectus]|uniref:DJ-1/PfpI family protein n=1 Tax=Streptomyces roseirectus TaxID=2768066 RepID=A0A7H0IBP7_9ACTN|nr:DJ-1/PfpI family protein [Streptomyces roseirectus]QNP70213.1 DJ-1/PfpI family protein [Streptomyces roseirectus]
MTNDHATNAHPAQSTFARRTLFGATAAAALTATTVGRAQATPSTRTTPHTRTTPTTSTTRATPTLRIGVYLYDGFSLLDPTGPTEVLSRLPGAEVTMIADRRRPISTDTLATTVLADRAFTEVDHLDVLLIPGGDERGTIGAMTDPALQNWIRAIHRRTRWTTSVCTGSVILAATGILDGREATTHWSAAEYLETHYDVTYLPRRYVESGRIITAAGVSAGIDMALYLAARLTDEHTARAIQLGIEYDPQPPFDAGDATKADAALKARAAELILASQKR